MGKRGVHLRHFLERHVGALVACLVVIIVAIIAMPNTTRLVREYGQTKIPASAQSQVANVMQNQWGRGQGNTRQVVVVFNNGKQPLSSTQKDNIAQTVRNFRDNKKHYHIKSVTAANDNAATRKQLVSKDKSTQLVQLMVGKKDTVRKMNKDISHAAKTVGVKTYVTGSDILNDDFSQATEEGIKKTEVIAAIFIFIVLIIVFRSPIVPLISLFTVGVSVLTSLSVVMNLVDYFNFPLSSFTQVFMVVVLFGIGTDYNILLYDQFKNELSNTDDAVAATRTARKIAGRTILYSGSSILIGFTALALAKFSIYRSAVGVAVGVAILLLVLLTLNPFFMATLGRRMFWPIKTFEAKSDSKLWHGLSKNSVLHPFIALGLVLLVTIPFLFTYSSQLNYDTVDELSDSLPAKQGFQVVQRHFSKGTAEPSTLYIQNNKKLNHEKYLKVIDQVTRKLQKEKGVKTVASVTQPGGSKVNELYVNRQLGTVTGGMKSAGKGLKTINKGLNKASTKLDQSNMQGGLSSVQQLIDGTGQLVDGSQQLTSGTGQLADGANTLSNGLGTLNSSTGTLASGVNQLTSGAYVLQNGVGQYTTGVGQLNTGLSQLAGKSGQVTSGVQQLVSQSSQLSLAVAELTAYNNGIASEINSNQSKLAQLSQAQSQLQGLSSQSAALKKKVKQAKAMQPQLTKMLTLLNSLQTAKTQIDQLQSEADALATTQKTLQSALKQIGAHDNAAADADKAVIAAAEKIVADDNASEASKAQAQTIIKTASDSLKNNLQANGNTLTQLKKQAEQTQLPDLTALADKLPSDSEISSLKSQLSNMNAMLDNADKADKLLGKTDQLATAASGLSDLQNKMSKLQTASNHAAAGLQQLNARVNGSGVNVNNQNTIQATIGQSQLLSQVNQLAAGLQQYTGGVDQAANGAQQLTANSAVLNGGAGQLANGLGTLNGQVPALTSGVSQLTTGANQLASGANQLNAKAPQLTAGLIQVNNGQKTMYTTLQGLVGQMQTLKNGLVDAQGGITKINKGVASADDYLGGLKGSAAAKNFYIPSSVLHGKTFGTAIKTYMSANKKITKMTIVLDSNPSSAKSMARIDALQSEVQNELKGTPLSGAKVAIGGQTATISDTHHIASGDFLRTAAIMLVGILFALMFITRSVLQPFYILGTLLLAYITSLSLTRWLSTAVLDQDMLTWNTPFFSFVMLVALGVDYSIFLMMKYREFGLSDGTPSTRIIAASGVIGAVVISAAIILSGTFAALIPSGVLTLIQVALAVIIGLVILVFILPVVISSLIRLTYPIDDTLNDNIKKRKH